MTRPKVMPVMVSYFSYGWIQQCVRCFREWFPELKILVVDNNPTSFDQVGSWGTAEVLSTWQHQYKFCLAERDWLKQQDDIILIPNKKKKRHGQGLDAALRWCREAEVDVMLAIDPDCVFHGIKWFYDLLEPIVTEDAWMTTPTQHIRHVDDIPWADGKKFTWWHRITIPSMHRVDKMKYSFGEIYEDNIFYDCMAWAYWNYEKTKAIGDIDENFKHYWCGSHLNQVDNNRNCPYFTFL